MTTEEKLLKIPVIRTLVLVLKKIKVPGLEGMSLYDVLEMYILGIVRGALTSRAGGIAFSFFMALFPAALFILTIIPYIPIENFNQIFTNFIAQVLPPETFTSVETVLDDISSNRYGGLLSFGFILSVFLMTNGINTLFGGFEYTYHQLQTRSIIKQYFISMMVALLLALLLFLTIGAIIYFEIAIHNLQESGYVDDDLFWINVSQYVLTFIMLFTTVATFYYLGTKEGRNISFFSAGAVLTTLLIIVNFRIFGIYVKRFAQYNELYGSIGTLLVIMLFIWLNSIILLLGFELNAAMIRLKRDSKKLK